MAGGVCKKDRKRAEARILSEQLNKILEMIKLIMYYASSKGVTLQITFVKEENMTWIVNLSPTRS